MPANQTPALRLHRGPDSKARLFPKPAIARRTTPKTGAGLAGWLVGWLAGWLVGGLAGWRVGGLAGWRVGERLRKGEGAKGTGNRKAGAKNKGYL